MRRMNYSWFLKHFLDIQKGKGKRAAKTSPTAMDQDASTSGREDVPATEPASSGGEGVEELEAEEYYDGSLLTEVDNEDDLQGTPARPYEVRSQLNRKPSSHSHSPAATEPASLSNTTPHDHKLVGSTGPNFNSMSFSQLVSPDPVKKAIKAISRTEKVIVKGMPLSPAQAYQILNEFEEGDGREEGIRRDKRRAGY
ncbi:hypothetical protein VKT23_020546 [Stygiomarasmius scandens]|uniref:Uncharacterized protein n=1 Tax=Marasmiellus scandens TaxID=2682957 RepID=A0ABR1IIW4_9AGAR